MSSTQAADITLPPRNDSRPDSAGGGVRQEGLGAEWQRIELLSRCALLARRGEAVSEEMKKSLQGFHASVELARLGNLWSPLIRQGNLTPLHCDILACCLAPIAEPHLGWLFQEMQPGVSTHFPTPALIREILFIREEESTPFAECLSAKSPLCRHGWLAARQWGMFTPLLPSGRAQQSLLGWCQPCDLPSIPGAVPIPARGRFEDLVLPRPALRSLEEFMLWITHRDQVESKWGAELSGGPLALFSGPSGTGKTFAAGALAQAIGWPLYRVDLGLLVSKYIGETEKNLNALFERAHGQQVMLLFDEADSLFGKRAEVKEARDRYANMEVSHLLSRIESHRGPCILTTNLRRHLDPAFARRFQMVIEFPRPEADSRTRLWRNHLPARAPLAAEVDFQRLGAELDFTGGQIRNILLHACVLAAREEGEIGWRHLARAAWLEQGKEGREVLSGSLGFLEAHLPRSTP